MCVTEGILAHPMLGFGGLHKGAWLCVVPAVPEGQEHPQALVFGCLS